jgi:hypothetical protein
MIWQEGIPMLHQQMLLHSMGKFSELEYLVPMPGYCLVLVSSLIG